MMDKVNLQAQNEEFYFILLWINTPSPTVNTECTCAVDFEFQKTNVLIPEIINRLKYLKTINEVYNFIKLVNQFNKLAKSAKKVK